MIHWIQNLPAKSQAHTYYYSKDQLELQDRRFKGRTFLFEDQISRGNASLQLTGVMVEDQGRYQCYTSTLTTNQESFISLSVNGMRNITYNLTNEKLNI